MVRERERADDGRDAEPHADARLAREDPLAAPEAHVRRLRAPRRVACGWCPIVPISKRCGGGATRVARRAWRARGSSATGRRPPHVRAWREVRVVSGRGGKVRVDASGARRRSNANKGTNRDNDGVVTHTQGGDIKGDSQGDKTTAEATPKGPTCPWLLP